MPPFILPILGFLRGLPWQVYVAAALVALLPLSYCKGKSDGKHEIRQAVAEASRKAQEKALVAESKANANDQERDAAFDESQKAIQEIVDEANATGSDPITAYFDGLRASQGGGDQTAP